MMKNSKDEPVLSRKERLEIWQKEKNDKQKNEIKLKKSTIQSHKPKIQKTFTAKGPESYKAVVISRENAARNKKIESAPQKKISKEANEKNETSKSEENIKTESISAFDRIRDGVHMRAVSDTLRYHIDQVEEIQKLGGLDAAITLLEELPRSTGNGDVMEFALYWAALSRLYEDAEQWDEARNVLNEGEVSLNLTPQKMVFSKIKAAYEERFESSNINHIEDYLEDFENEKSSEKSENTEDVFSLGEEEREPTPFKGYRYDPMDESYCYDFPTIRLNKKLFKDFDDLDDSPEKASPAARESEREEVITERVAAVESAIDKIESADQRNDSPAHEEQQGGGMGTPESAKSKAVYEESTGKIMPPPKPARKSATKRVIIAAEPEKRPSEGPLEGENEGRKVKRKRVDTPRRQSARIKQMKEKEPTPSPIKREMDIILNEEY